MSKQNVNIRQLMIFDQQIQQKRGTVDWIFDKGKITSFYNDNQVRLKSAYEKRDTILKDFCAIDEKGMVKFADEQKNIPVILEGKSMADFTKVMEELLNTEVAMEV